MRGWEAATRECAAKLNRVKEQIAHRPKGPAFDPSSRSFPAARIRKLLRSLKAALSESLGAPLSFPSWARISGRPSATLFSWCEAGEVYQLQALLASLERLPEQRRHQLVDEACRLYPTLRHRNLAHDPLAVSSLDKLLRQASGLTVIEGDSDHRRTFLLTALGHSYPAPEGSPGTAGLDIHEPNSFVPVLGVTYFPNPLHAAELLRQINQAWPAVLSANAHLVLLNGVWTRAPKLQPDILELAHGRHVILADAPFVKPSALPGRMPFPFHVVTVCACREAPDWIKIDIQAL